jgi:hypothetical protein
MPEVDKPVDTAPESSPEVGTWGEASKKNKAASRVPKPRMVMGRNSIIMTTGRSSAEMNAARIAFFILPP